MANKNLFVCLDGTWSNRDSGESETNIAILARIFEDIRPWQLVHYESGVGTVSHRDPSRKVRFLDWIRGGVFGKGLSENIENAYWFLSQNYEPGDNIYIFGYSRGAFAARSLCGFLSTSGLLHKEMCDENLESAWNYYRTPPKYRYRQDYRAIRAKLDRISHDFVDHPDGPRVQFLGVFDTVGALGVPKTILGRIGINKPFEFHDTELSRVVKHSCQALAIDEGRINFEPALWVNPRKPRKTGTVEQVWFPGSHANIGGGGGDRKLSDLVLVWMLTRLLHHCPELKHNLSRDLCEEFERPHCTGKKHPSREFWPLTRVINQIEPRRRWFYPSRLQRLPPHRRPIGEKLHVSALARLEQSKGYRPVNLRAVVERLQSNPNAVEVMGIDGERIPGEALRLWLNTGAADANATQALDERSRDRSDDEVELPA